MLTGEGMATGGIVVLAVLFFLSTFNVNFCYAIEFESSVYTYNISEEAVGLPYAVRLGNIASGFVQCTGQR